MSNPFRFRELSPGDPFCNRLQEQKRLLSCGHAPANVVLFSPRRYGKTSLTRRVQAQLSERGFVTVYVDFFGVSSVYEVAGRIARSVYRALHQRESLLKKGKRFLTLQRNLSVIEKFTYASSPVGQVGAMVSGLDPKDLFDQAFHGMLFHRQQYLEQDSKLRQRNGWCFFSPT